jgi:hypothetical protein
MRGFMLKRNKYVESILEQDTLKEENRITTFWRAGTHRELASGCNMCIKVFWKVEGPNS